MQDRVHRDAGFAAALLEEAVQSLLDADVGTARSLIRDVIKGSLGYSELSARTAIPAKSLIRMFGPSGNPTLANVATVLEALQHFNGVALKIERSSAVSRSRDRTVRRSGAVRTARTTRSTQLRQRAR